MPKYNVPDPVWLAAAQCAGKHRFDDAGMAKKVAKQSSQRKDKKCTAYKCKTCSGWHIGESRDTKPMKER